MASDPLISTHFQPNARTTTSFCEKEKYLIVLSGMEKENVNQRERSFSYCTPIADPRGGAEWSKSIALRSGNHVVRIINLP